MPERLKMKSISDTEVEKRIKAWADVTMLSLELKRAMLKKKRYRLKGRKITEIVRKEFSK